MKKIYRVLLILILWSVTDLAWAQSPNLPGLDPSPADITYLREGRRGEPFAKIIYCRPQKKGRDTFSANSGALAQYGKVWRTGANETTELHVYKAIKIGDVSIEPGTYSVYTIPGEKEWTMILNTKLHTWGHFEHDASMDKYKITGSVKAYDPMVEAFTIYFAGIADNKSTLYMAWDTTIVEFPVEL